MHLWEAGGCTCTPGFPQILGFLCFTDQWRGQGGGLSNFDGEWRIGKVYLLDTGDTGSERCIGWVMVIMFVRGVLARYYGDSCGEVAVTDHRLEPQAGHSLMMMAVGETQYESGRSQECRL